MREGLLSLVMVSEGECIKEEAEASCIKSMFSSLSSHHSEGREVTQTDSLLLLRTCIYLDRSTDLNLLLFF